MNHEAPSRNAEGQVDRRPVSVLVIGALFICVGLGAIASGVWRAFVPAGFSAVINDSHAMIDLALVALSGIVAIVGGALLLRGQRWGRWLVVFWLAAHVVISLDHDRFELVVHGLLFVLVVTVLYRRAASSYLRPRVV